MKDGTWLLVVNPSDVFGESVQVKEGWYKKRRFRA